MSLELTNPPAAEPVTLETAKAHLKLDSDAEDALILAMIRAARARAEWHTGRAFVTQGWTLWRDRWPQGAGIEIPLPPLQSVGDLTTYAPDDTPTVLDPAAYQVDLAAGRIAPRSLFPPAFANLRPLNAISVAFTAGYGDAPAVPPAIAQAILEIVASTYAHRGDEAGDLPASTLSLLQPYRVVKL